MNWKRIFTAVLCILPVFLYTSGLVVESDLSYKIVDTGQTVFYNNSAVMSAPDSGELFYGQDAGYTGKAPAYTDNGDGTITDLVTGLMWQKTPDLDNKIEFDAAFIEADTLSLGGYTDWRVPTIKELYSLQNFSGSSVTETPYIDTAYFDFVFGDESKGERLIDAQYWSSTEYVGLTMGGDETVFGVNFADGRIKGYPKVHPQNGANKMFVRYVRGNTGYGVNDFVDNGDGTITDRATGLMWQQNDSGDAMLWQDALAYAEALSFAGYDDWRLPNAKELQSIVDYTKAPEALEVSARGKAIDEIFSVTEEESWYWTGTTLLESPPEQGVGKQAIYVTFGRATGYMEQPPNSGNYVLLDVHGAGAQRSDPKTGDPADYPYGHGPQGDVIRIYNYVRCVRDAGDVATGINNDTAAIPRTMRLDQNYPNPFNPETTISYSVYKPVEVSLKVYDLIGSEIAELTNGIHTAGEYTVTWDGKNSAGQKVASGMYIYQLRSDSSVLTRKMILLK